MTSKILTKNAFIWPLVNFTKKNMQTSKTCKYRIYSNMRPAYSKEGAKSNKYGINNLTKFCADLAGLVNTKPGGKGGRFETQNAEHCSLVQYQYKRGS